MGNGLKKVGGQIQRGNRYRDNSDERRERAQTMADTSESRVGF